MDEQSEPCFDDVLKSHATEILSTLCEQSDDLRGAMARSIYQLSLQLAFLSEHNLLIDYSEWINEKLMDRHLDQAS
ncbi:MAG: hypothetical protein KDK35_04615 [Leptospiraceae bacterium]|nr:hypothetical protein [Leptospiraceae bacterium]MCP5485989.1 hypothetical protein [Spirochaetales bacterium]